MKWLILAVSIIVLLLITTGILSGINILLVVPWLTLIFLATSIVIGDKNEWIFIALVGGFLTDLISALPDGIITISYLLAAGTVFILLSWFLAKEFNIGIIFLSAGLVTLLSFILQLILVKFFVLFELTPDLDYTFQLTRNLPWLIFLNLLAAYPIYLYYLLVQNLLIRTQKFK